MVFEGPTSPATFPIFEDDEVETFNLSSDSVFSPATSGSSLFIPPARKDMTKSKRKAKGKNGLGEPQKPVFSCVTCGKKYKTLSGLKDHTANHKLEG